MEATKYELKNKKIWPIIFEAKHYLEKDLELQARSQYSTEYCREMHLLEVTDSKAIY